MATFIDTIQLNDATKQDYENLFSKLEKQVLKSKYHIVKGRRLWTGKVNINGAVTSLCRRKQVQF